MPNENPFKDITFTPIEEITSLPKIEVEEYKLQISIRVPKTMLVDKESLESYISESINNSLYNIACWYGKN